MGVYLGWGRACTVEDAIPQKKKKTASNSEQAFGSEKKIATTLSKEPFHCGRTFLSEQILTITASDCVFEADGERQPPCPGNRKMRVWPSFYTPGSVSNLTPFPLVIQNRTPLT